jgi:hypothetical protein
MAAVIPKYSMEELARRGDAAYERVVVPILQPSQHGQFVAIDADTSEYEIAATELEASDRLRARLPNAQIWLKRVGSRSVRHFGYRVRPAKS